MSNQFRPAILQTFGDIAQAIGLRFEKYLSVVAQVLQTAANVTMGDNAAFEMLDYVISLREGIMDAWSGAILSLKSKRMYSNVNGKGNVITSYSPATDAIRGIHIHRPECDSTRSKPQRGTPAVSYGCYRVSLWQCH